MIRSRHSVTSEGPAILIRYPVLVAKSDREGPVAVPTAEGGQL